jgi:hypothetical protein
MDVPVEKAKERRYEYQPKTLSAGNHFRAMAEALPF